MIEVSSPRYRAIATIGAVAVLIGVAGCSSSKPKAPAATSSMTTAATSASAASTTTSAAAAGGAADPATVSAVTQAYLTFFNPATAEPAATALLQDGAAFKTAIEAAAKQAQTQKTSATVSTVTLQSPNTAKVIFSVLANGTVVAANQTGYAVREDGTWKVAGQTFCGLLSIQGTPPPACQLSAATDLPN